MVSPTGQRAQRHFLTPAHGAPTAQPCPRSNLGQVRTHRGAENHGAHDHKSLSTLISHAGRRRRRPDVLYVDRGYGHDIYRKQVREPGIRPVIARRGTDHGSGLGKTRWVVEAAFALLHWFRRLRIRWEVRADIHQAFLTLGCTIICWRRLKTSF
ncbi:transposase [Streptomyces sp. CA-106110]|uniref:transposase n=1 Tax=Streptomyces sp. CA-106110 TaxID=3240044 RepID=UPI003D8A76B1